MNGEEFEGWKRITEASKYFGVTAGTLRRWSDENKVQYKRTFGNQRLYCINKPVVQKPEKSQCYIYVRVSSKKQVDDLQRQKQFLLDKYPGYNVIEDVGSGINYKRKGLRKLLLLSLEGKCKEVVVSHKDRLCRFGFELLEFLFSQNFTKLTIVDKTTKTHEQEFSEDILSILQVYCCKWNGKRRYKTDTKTIEIECFDDNEKIQNETNDGTETTDKQMERP
jgi:predicted site-specific integrase-resolvase